MGLSVPIITLFLRSGHFLLRILQGTIIPFQYVTVGSYHPLTELDVISRGQLDLSQNCFTLPGSIGKSLIPATYLDLPSITSLRLFLSVFPSHCPAVTSLYYVSEASWRKPRLLGYDNKRVSHGLIHNRVAYTLHAYRHLHHNDLNAILQWDGFLIPLLHHALRDAHRQ